MVNLDLKLPESFFEEEIRCGFTVTRERKELWAVELDLLMQLDRVCKKNGLKYMLGAGSLLGAIRHNGFIPWDDDIDVYMLRDDYNKLLTLGDEFQEPYFLQNFYTERCSIRTHSRLRNSETTGHTIAESTVELNKGIFIDVFPLDGVSDSSKKNDVQEKRNKWYGKLFKYYLGISVESFQAKSKRFIISLMITILGKDFFCRRMDKNLSRYSRPGTKVWGNRTIHFDCPRSRRPLEDYTNLILWEFEGFQLPIPANYDAMLTQQYGNYMEIPEIKPESVHGELIVSTSVSYRVFSPEMMDTDGESKACRL